MSDGMDERSISENMALEGGRCANCKSTIGSYQFAPGQTQRGGRNFCSTWCARQFGRVNRGR